jgi:hypothetical protein
MPRLPPCPLQVTNPTSCLTLLVDKHLAAIADRKASLAEPDLTCLSSPGMLALLMAWERPLQGLFRDLAGAGPGSNRPSASELQSQLSGGGSSGSGPGGLGSALKRVASTGGVGGQLARSPSLVSLARQSSGGGLLVSAAAGCWRRLPSCGRLLAALVLQSPFASAWVPSLPAAAVALRLRCAGTAGRPGSPPGQYCSPQGEPSYGGAELEVRVRLGDFLGLLQERGVMPEMLGRGEVEEVLRRVLLASDCPALATSVGRVAASSLP